MYEEKIEEFYVINIIDTENVYDGIIERFTQLSSPVLSYNGEDNLFGVIMSSEFSFNILNETAEDGKYTDLFTGQENRWMIEVRKIIKTYREDSPEPSVRNFVYWKGFLMPDIYSEPYENGVFFVDFTATDSLATLKNKDFNFPYTSSVIQYISYCLRRTGLSLEMLFRPHIQNSAYTNWNNILLPIDNFEGKEGTRLNCYEVLEQLLKAMGCVLYQRHGAWYVEGHAERLSGSLNYDLYNSYGKFISKRWSIRQKINADFDRDSMQISMMSPFRKVQLNVGFEAIADTLFPEKVYLNTSLNPSDVTNPADVYPMKAWAKNGSTVVVAGADEPGLLSVVGDQEFSEDVSHIYLEQGAYPYYNYENGVKTAFYVPTNLNWNYNNDYIELKSSEAFFISPKKEGSPFVVDAEMEIDYYNYPYEDRFEDGYYLNACRVDLLINNSVVFSTRKENENYQPVTDYEFEDRQAYGDVSIYEWPNYLQVAYTMPYSYSQPKVNAVISAKNLAIENYGKLRLRVFIPKTRNGQNTDYRLMWTRIKDLSGKVIGWEDEEHVTERLINYTTNFERDLKFYDGKNDFYKNLFSPGQVKTINPNSGYELFEGFVSESETDQFYIWHFPVSPFAPIVKHHFETNYNFAIIKNGNDWMQLSMLLGKLNSKDVFFEENADEMYFVLKISKSLILSLPKVERDFFLNKTGIFLETFTPTWVQFPPSYNQHLLWENSVTGNQGRYLDVYAESIHEMHPTPTSRISGVIRTNVTPHDLVRFNWMGEKTYVPTRLSINLADNKTDILMIEANYQELNDYVRTD